MAPHIQTMRENIARVLCCDVGQINVKATTTEQLGFAGRGEGIAAYSVALMERA
jgi:2-C-methyl-D-erythritol 2,4-cyclodiphosphate synthase